MQNRVIYDRSKKYAYEQSGMRYVWGVLAGHVKYGRYVVECWKGTWSVGPKKQVNCVL